MSAGTSRSLAEGQATALLFRDKYVPDAIIGGSIRRGEGEVHDIDLMTLTPLSEVRARLASGVGDATISRDGEKSIFIEFMGFTINLYVYEPEYITGQCFSSSPGRSNTLSAIG